MTQTNMFQAEGADRYTIFPIKHKNLWDFYKKHEATFWTVEEIRLSDDLVDWNTKLNKNEQYFIKNVLAFFAASDGIVNENLVTNFYNEVQIPEARSFYTVQMMLESIHSEMYSLLIDTYVMDSEEKAHLFNAMETVPAIKEKAEWAIKWIEEGSSLQQTLPIGFLEQYRSIEKTAGNTLTEEQKRALSFLTKDRPSFAQRLLAFVCVEGLFFSGSFCAIYWLKNRGLMPGLSTSNEFISRDENLHCEFAIELYRMLDQKIPQETAHGIFLEAVNIEKRFVTESLPVSLIGMNSTLMQQYIEFVADRWLIMLGYEKLFNSANPFPFMELISLNTKENFFELNVSQYQKSSVGTTAQDREISFDEEF
jgi:ribonucleoside-diphosphate reductase beta chain